MLFVLKTTALTPLLACDRFPQDNDLLSIVLWQAITVQQNPLRFNVLQVSKSGMFLVLSLMLFLSCRVVYFMFHRLQQDQTSPILLTPPRKVFCSSRSFVSYHMLRLSVRYLGRSSFTYLANGSLLLHTICSLAFNLYLSLAHLLCYILC
jgi:hypothetical protein